MSALFRQVFIAALLGGAVAGVVLTGLQLLAVIPMVQEAETYESAGAGGHDHSHGHGATGAASEGPTQPAWAPVDGLERTAYTGLANVITAIAFALLLSAGYAMRGTVDWRRGILWGVGGFAAFNLAPALGLPPELPGAATASLEARQAWWLATVVLTAGGLALMVFAARHYIKGLGLLLLVFPHLMGAPQPEAHGGLAPAELAQSFIYAVLATNLVFWLLLGAVTGFLFSWMETPQPQQSDVRSSSRRVSES